MQGATRVTRTLHIVEDGSSFRESLRNLFSAQTDLIIRCYPSGDMFLAQAGEVDPGVLLLSSHMPGANGLEVLNAIRSEQGRYAPVVLTDHGDVALAVATMKAGALDFVEKRCDPTKLLEIVEAAFVGLERNGAALRRTKRAQDVIGRLSPRERDVLIGLVKGRSNKAIAAELDLSPRTVEIHRANMMEKLEAGSVSAAVRLAYVAGLFDLDEEGGTNSGANSA